MTATPDLSEDAVGALVDAAAPVLGLAVAPEWRPSVIANLRTVAEAARLVLEFPLPDELEPAPVFGA